MRTHLIVWLALSLAVAGPASAQFVQPVPVPAEELAKAYSGKTISLSDASLYWGPDGKIIGIAPGDLVGEGTWSAADGKVCFETAWQRPGDAAASYSRRNCYGYMRVGTHVFHQSTSEKTRTKTGWYDGNSDLQALQPGNLLQERYDAIKAKDQVVKVQHYSGLLASQPAPLRPQD
jgi:hypothetical protein